MPDNLFAVAPPQEGELFDELLRCRDVVIERIVSSGSPEPGLYDQDQDEWVVLLRGSATVEVRGDEVALGEGDHLFLPAHTPHRVTAASEGAVWLAVHIYR